MSPELEALQQRWRDTGDVQAHAQYLSALVASGRLESRRLEMAAALGHKAALAAAGTVPKLPEHYRSRIETAASVLSHREAVSFAVDCAERSLVAWEAIRGNDRRPRAAVDIARQWLSGKPVANLLETIGRGASDARIEADAANQYAEAAPELAAAFEAAEGASHAAFAAETAQKIATNQDPGAVTVEGCAAYSARCAALAASNPDAERSWQIQRLIDYLLSVVDERLPR